MYLKSIEVQGFKSFANKITFEFHNGITGIVGPNGSGKSNVGDAVRWVLGEQSAKQLRGGNMQDVIFSGTETRKPLGFAYVAITLDNSDHQLAVDYEEVTVARRLYRSGESEYLLNGTSCRLKDVHELFYDTGIGKEGYSIIGQGQIDKILSGRPEERRELFDEAAGIVKFKRRKATALKKLEDEQQNLVRVHDILSEITKQLAPLEKQSEAARVYLKKKEELKLLETNMFLVEMDHIKSQLLDLHQKQEIAAQDLQETTKIFEQTKNEYEQLEKDMELLDAKIQVNREKASQNALLKQQLENQVDILKEQIHATRQNDTHFQERVKALVEDLKKHKKDSGQYIQENKSIEEQMRSMEEQKKQVQAQYEKEIGQIRSLQESIEESKNEIIELLNLRASTKGKMQRYTAMLEQINIRKAELSQRVLRLKSEETEQEEIQLKYREEYTKLTESIEEQQQESSRKEAEVLRLQSLLAQQNQKMDIGQTAYHREASRLESLKNITERYDGYGNSIRRVMEQKKAKPGIKGVVADLIKVDKNYETAIETALGGSIQNIVTDNENTAKEMISYLKNNKYGRATFLPLTSMGNKNAFSNQAALKEEGVIGVASDLIQADTQYKGLANYLLGRTLVIDHIDHGIAIARKYHYTIRMVTIEGESLNPGGSLTGGAFKNTSNLLGRRREIEELESSVKALQADMEQMQQEIEGNRVKRNDLRDDIAKLGEILQEQYLLQNTAKLNIESALERTQNIQLGYGRLRLENREIEEQIQEIQENSSSIQIELEISSQEEKKLEEMIENDQHILEEKKEQETKQKQILDALSLETANFSSKRGFIRENLDRIQKEMQTLGDQLTQMQSNLQEGAKDITKKEADIESIQLTIRQAEEETLSDAQKMMEFQTAKESMTLSHKSFFEKRDELSNRMNLLDKECFRLVNQVEKLEENQESQMNYMWEEYEITYNQALENRIEEYKDRSSIKRDIGSVKDEIRKLGDVNVNAIEDYKNLSERHIFLQTQHDDLVQAEATLLTIIDELDTGMRNQFQEKFEQIRIEFDKAFKELFGGGKGTLELMVDENQDILEAGIKIISQPPGKKLQNMMQLSGGEKALTAIALLFAIQNLKPSPFCLLDEIEAALDDSNVTRYAKYLHKLTKNTQFIIITHRRGTMTAADRLYGITMQEKGVSTLVSVNLIENDLDK